MGDELELWTDFNVAMAGATAALAGLVIVAASVNISEIVKFRALTARLAAAIAALVLAIVASALALIPGITPIWLGILLIASAAAAGVFQVVASVEIFADDDPAAQAKFVKSAFGFLPIAAYIGAGIAMPLVHPAALYLAAAGGILAIVTAILASWVALVEVLR
jgi:hypothetical protein